MNLTRNQKVYGLYTLFFMSSLVVLVLSYGYLTSLNKATYLQESTQSYENQISSTIERYQEFSAYIYSKVIDETVLETLYNAQIDPGNQDILRNELYDYLLGDYELITMYNFRQFHFIFPNGDSFLRFHQPDIYGDNLTDTRESVRIANEELRPAFGFEEGRLYNGYRFVYPLIHNGIHVGAVEISIPITTLMSMLYDLNPNAAYFFIIRKDRIEELVFDQIADNFVQSVLSDAYVYDQTVNSQFTNERSVLTGNQLVSFLSHISSDVSHRLEDNQTFSHVGRYQNKNYTLQFINLTNIEGNQVAYIFSVKVDKQYNDMVTIDIIAYISLITITLLAYLVGLLYVIDKEHKTKYAQQDPLTKLMNRRYFNRLAMKEIEKACINNQPITMVVSDIDYFKEINDTYGHLKGDEVLQRVADVLVKNTRSTDYVARWGGEEFAILLVGTKLSDAIERVKQIQKALLTEDFGIVEHIKMSYGIANEEGDACTLDSLFSIADERLYKAKRTGRNKYVAS